MRTISWLLSFVFVKRLIVHTSVVAIERILIILSCLAPLSEVSFDLVRLSLHALITYISSHLPLRCTLTLTIPGEGVKGPSSRVQSSTSHRTVLDWSSSDRNDAYRRRLTELLAQRIPVCSNAEQLDAQLTVSIHEAAADTGCSRRWRPPKPWWTPAISAARDRARFWHRLWTNAGRPRNTVLHNCFRAARSSYRRARVDAAHAKADSGARLLSVLRRDKNIKAFWRRVESSRRGSDVSRSILTADDFENHLSPIHMDNEVLSPEHEEVCRRVATLLAEARSNPGPDRRVSADDRVQSTGHVNPRTGGGLSQPRTGGGVDFNPPVRSRELRNASISGKRC